VSDVVVDHFLPGYTLREFLDHQLRWARTIRDSRRWGYAGLIITFPLVWSALAVLLSVGSTWSWLLLAATALMRSAVAWVGAKSMLQDPQLTRDFWLVPLRDALALAIWAGSFTGHNVLWRGIEFKLKDGKLRPA
jgi:ceramide glucosyltransferase